MSIFKAYDIRGIYGEDLTAKTFYKIARAYARFLGRPNKIVVARDCRKSSDELFDAFATGLNEEGVDVIDIGLASTPMSYFANGILVKWNVFYFGIIYALVAVYKILFYFQPLVYPY